jgi:hypothetical protein
VGVQNGLKQTADGRCADESAKLQTDTCSVSAGVWTGYCVNGLCGRMKWDVVSGLLLIAVNPRILNK